MAEMEKGVKLQKLYRTESDSKLVKKEKQEVEDYLSNLKPKKMDKIPLGFVGKGPKGYILYDMAFHRTNKAPKVT